MRLSGRDLLQLLALHEERCTKAGLWALSLVIVIAIVYLPSLMAPSSKTAKGIPIGVKVRPVVPPQLTKEAEIAIEINKAELDAPPKVAVDQQKVEAGVKERPALTPLDAAETPVIAPPVLREEEAVPNAQFSANQEMFLDSGVVPENLEFSVLPPTPGDDYTPELSSDEMPGGDVLVLGVLVDHSGRVLDARIVVPSRNPINDLSFFIASKDVIYTGIDPPIHPGSPRWIPIQLKYERPGNEFLP